MKNFNSTWPNYSNEQIKLVSSILKSGNVNYWTGKYCKYFEKKFSQYHKIKYSIAVNSGTSALDCAIKSLDLKKGSEIITTPRSYYTSASSIINCEMKPKFIGRAEIAMWRPVKSKLPKPFDKDFWG